MPTPSPRRLIEVDLPIREISAHARREKSIRHGHISTLHIWWARRPLAACRAVLCAALWPDPADEHCPQPFREAVARALAQFAEQVRTDSALTPLITRHWSRWVRTNATSLRADQPANWPDMRYALLDFIADFANWDASTVPAFLETARTLTQAAHESLGGLPGTRPLVVDPFAGGGAIPLEALRVGADAFASDLNPVAVLLNKVVLEYIPRYGQQLADEVRKWGQWIKEQALTRVGHIYPDGPDGSTSNAYIWARTIICEGPTCGVEIPLIRNLQLTRKGREWYLDLKVEDTSLNISVCEGKTKQLATVRGGSATCPRCGYTTPSASVRKQLAEKHGGGRDARLLAVYSENSKGRFFRNPTETDLIGFKSAQQLFDEKWLPKDLINPVRPYKNSRGVSAVTRIGITQFGELYNPRQAVILKQFQELALEAYSPEWDTEFRRAVATCLYCVASRFIFQNTTLSRWHATRLTIEGMFGKQALQIVWDFVESNPLSNGSANWDGAIEWVLKVIEANAVLPNAGTISLAPAQVQTLPDEIAQALITDPPYFAAIPYADLSNVFFVWEREFYKAYHPELYSDSLVNQTDELIVTNANTGADGVAKSSHYYQTEMAKALTSARKVVRHDGIGVVVFADSSTESWEAILGAIIDAGWKVTGSWPIDTELQNRTQASDSASLQSSIHLVCRPRETVDGELSTTTGDWREVLRELPGRIHAWLPRLAQEGVVGADAIFACLGPALEIFSRYSRVEKASGETVSLREYLEYVWAAVSREALTMIFQGADATGFEEDARLTAMWLWTLSAATEDGGQETGDGGLGTGAGGQKMLEDGGDETDDEDAPAHSAGKPGGFTLEYDAARKIAQGLGAHLEKLDSHVEIKGDKATLIPVRARERVLFGREGLIPGEQRREKASPQLSFLDTLSPDPTDSTTGWEPTESLTPGTTTLDKVHQAMLLFASGRGGALKRFLVDDAIGRDERFWRLAQALSALYPSASDEKRWVDGVLGRKKGLGF